MQKNTSQINDSIFYLLGQRSYDAVADAFVCSSYLNKASKK